MPAPSKVAPVSTIPFEILDKILDECLQSVTTGSRDLSIKHTLIHICREWRLVMFSQPKFWTTLTIDIGVPSAYLRFLIREALRVCQPLDVSVDTGEIDLTLNATPDYKYPWILETFITLGNAVNRIRDLSVTTSGQPSLTLILRVLRVEQATNLQHISVALCHERFLHVPAPMVALSSMHLKSFTIDKVIPVWEDTSFLSRISTLTIGGLRMTLTWKRLRSLLLVAKHITSLAFHDLVCHPLPHRTPHIVELEELLSFQLVFGHTDDLEVVSLIRMPNLKTVRIIGLPDAPWASLPLTCSFLLRKPINLVLTPGYGSQLLPSILHPLPATYFLDIQAFPLQFVKDLFLNDGKCGLSCPKLRTLVTCGAVEASLIRSVAECAGSTEVSVLEPIGRDNLPFNFRKWYFNGDNVETTRVLLDLEKEMMMYSDI
ncbi:hypothetical protein R3P38DRAFT_3188505 [Favolaschia claudopus]|uniref:F-box domain-containing protein n=1 Tax=Favolaschia claudopus TaxID=2862362 RepID=A0AAW0BXM5_9AGAR